jgi:thiamine kinase-like enzyme
VVVNGKRFVFRINIQQQSGLADQIDYEFRVMKFLEPYQITARVFHCDNTKSHFEFDVLIEEYLEGPWVSLTVGEMPAIAALLVRLHSLETSSLQLITWRDPLMDTRRLVEMDLAEYKSKKSAKARVISLTENFLKIMTPRVIKKRGLFSPGGLNHTDVAIDNFVNTTQGLKLIDWEKPRLDDCSYDVCCFLAKPAQLWCTPRVLSQKGRETFLREYIRLAGVDEDLFREKVQVREPLVAIHWIFWGMNRMCDLKDQTTASALQQVHEERVSRWERIADPLLIEKLIEEE